MNLLSTNKQYFTAVNNSTYKCSKYVNKIKTKENESTNTQYSTFRESL